MESMEKWVVEQLKLGDEHSYQYIYDHHYVFLCCIAQAYVNDHYVAESIVGDVIFHLWEIRETLEITVSLRAYLAQAVRRRALNYLSSAHKEYEVSLSELPAGEWSPGETFVSEAHPLGILLERELETEIRKAINRLPDECRTVFRKSRFEGKKYKEIAEELGISINTVKYHLKRGLTLLHNDLGKYLFTLYLLFFK